MTFPTTKTTTNKAIIMIAICFFCGCSWFSGSHDIHNQRKLEPLFLLNTRPHFSVGLQRDLFTPVDTLLIFHCLVCENNLFFFQACLVATFGPVLFVTM